MRNRLSVGAKISVPTLAKQEAEWLRGQAIAAESRAENSRIPANASLNPQQLAYLQTKIAGWNPKEKTSTALIDALLRDTPSTDDPAETMRSQLDEVLETMRGAKTLILRSGEPIYAKWVDFDGTKRPEGIMFSVYAGLIFEDINFGSEGFFSEEEKLDFQKTYSDFCKIDSIIHALNTALQQNGAAPERITALEQVMDELKKRRFEKTQILIQMRNTMDRRRKSESLENNMLMLSKRIRFLPRLDRAFVQAYLKNKKSESLTDQEQNHLKTFRSICQQVAEINDLSTLTDDYAPWESKTNTADKKALLALPIIPQVMLAECHGYEEMEAIAEAFCSAENLLRESKLIKNFYGHLTDNIALVPLFEGDHTTSPTAIKNYLSQVWQNAGQNDIGRSQAIAERHNEIFIAGSDLSKEMGHLGALLRIYEVDRAIEEFNQANKTKIVLKLGSGEAVSRQLGFLDPEGTLPLVRGKISRTDDKTAATKLLAEYFGEDWREILKQKPTGLQWLLERLPCVNSITLQSCGKENLIFFGPGQSRALIAAARAQHKSNFDQKEIREPPTGLHEGAAAEQAHYQALLGRPGEKRKIDGLRGLPAVLQSITRLIPVIRDRGIARTSEKQDFFTMLEKQLSSGIDARAIATNTAASLIFPLALVGKAAAITAVKEQSEKLSELLWHLPVKHLLREIKVYEQIATEIFVLLQINGFEKLANTLTQEWEALLSLRPILQAELWQQVLSQEAYKQLQEKLTGKSDTENDKLKQQIAQTFVPGTRELFLDNFTSKRTASFKNAFAEHGRPALTPVLEKLALQAGIWENLEKLVNNLAQRKNHNHTSAQRIIVKKLNDKKVKTKFKKEEAKIYAELKKLYEENIKRESHPDTTSKENFSQLLKALSYAYGRLG